jgi:hypothetical protein
MHHGNLTCDKLLVDEFGAVLIVEPCGLSNFMKLHAKENSGYQIKQESQIGWCV